MDVLVGLAFVSGIVTILSPCILPVLPIVLAGGLTGSRARPYGIVVGFVASFTAFTLALSAIVHALGISASALRTVAVAVIVVFGVVLLVPRLSAVFERGAARLGNLGGAGQGEAAPTGGRARAFWTGVPIGLSLGLVWTPCVGPIMASVVALALTRQVSTDAVAITLAYATGTAIPMLAVMLAGRRLVRRAHNLARLQRAFGVLLIITGVAIGTGWDRQFQTTVLQALPAYGRGLTSFEQTAAVRRALADERAQPQSPAGAPYHGAPDVLPQNGELGDYGLAPPLVAAGPWYNTPQDEPLTMEGLRGKVVLIDFWTYSCVNCVRTLPYVHRWYDSYKDQGLVVIGVHTPEFEFEKAPANVRKAIADLHVDWPVVQDNDYQQWQAYQNQYWPAEYFIDARGHVRYIHFGEGDYDVSERVIRALLAEAGTSVAAVALPPPPSLASQTPETYLGYRRAASFASAVAVVPDKVARYRPAHVPAPGEWNLEGSWTITPQYVEPQTAGTLALGFDAKDVYLVIEPEASGGSVQVTVDGKTAADTEDVTGGVLRPTASRLYHLVHLPAAGPHTLTLDVEGRLRLFAFTFG